MLRRKLRDHRPPNEQDFPRLVNSRFRRRALAAVS
jgi:hypothetical protein